MIKDSTENIYKGFYVVAAIAAFIFVIYVALNFSSNTYMLSTHDMIIPIDSFDVYSEDGEYLGTSKDDIYVDENDVIVMKTILPDDIPSDFFMGFHSNHLNIEIYAKDTLIFSFTKGDSSFGETPGYGYHMVPELYNYAGEELAMYISSPYGISYLPEVELARSQTLFYSQLSASMLPFGVAIITLIVGVLILIYGIYTIIRANVNKSFIFLGMFTITLAIYTANEQTIFLLMTGNHVFSAYLSFIGLMFLPVPFILFLKELYTNKKHIIWYILLTIDFISIITNFVLQIFDILDFKETLKFTHVTFVIIILSTIVFTVYEVIKFKMTTSMKLNISCISLVAACLAIDMVIYYNSDGDQASVFGNLGFLIYIIVVGCHSIRNNTTLIAKGQQAERYKTLAYKDNLTGIYNRTAHDNDLSKADTSVHRYIIGMFDLNDLKYYNDHLGHEIGDKYITSCADIIKDSFSDISNGHCYRIGGDEFCVILTDKTADDFNSAIDKMNAAVDEFNKQSDKLKIHIASGFAEFDLNLDKNLKETRSRADAMMYKNKFLMKQEQGNLK